MLAKRMNEHRRNYHESRRDCTCKVLAGCACLLVWQLYQPFSLFSGAALYLEARCSKWSRSGPTPVDSRRLIHGSASICLAKRRMRYQLRPSLFNHHTAFSPNLYMLAKWDENAHFGYSHSGFDSSKRSIQSPNLHPLRLLKLASNCNSSKSLSKIQLTASRNLQEWPQFSTSPLFYPPEAFEEALNRVRHANTTNGGATSKSSNLLGYGSQPNWYYPKDFEAFKLKLQSLDPSFLKKCEARSLAPTDKRFEFDNHTGFFKINYAILCAFKGACDNLKHDTSSVRVFKERKFLQVVEILEYTTVPIQSTAVALVILREGGMKLKGEERYLVIHGTHKSSILRRIEDIIMDRST